jgi:hypothetical protein
MRTWAREHGLALVNGALFVAFFVGMILSGSSVYSQDQVEHHQPAVSVVQYLGTGDFLEATFENWESEFLQMGSYVALTVFLFQRGSQDSKPIGEDAPQDEDPREAKDDRGAPWPVQRGGLALAIYQHSLLILFGVLFLLSVLLHAVGGAAAYDADQVAHGQPPIGVVGFLGTAQFWFQSFQNWQSEFMVVTVMVLASVWLRERGSSQSKPVAASSGQTGG